MYAKQPTREVPTHHRASAPKKVVAEPKAQAQAQTLDEKALSIRQKRLINLEAARKARDENARLKKEGKPPNPPKYPKKTKKVATEHQCAQADRACEKCGGRL